jgi:hypothetical protein
MASPADRVAGISSAQDRVQPSLLDRLTDDDPMNRRDGRDMRGFSLARLRDSVLRDLSWLMNASQLAATRDLGRLPHVAASVLNYGIPPTTGKVKAAIDAAAWRAMSASRCCASSRACCRTACGFRSLGKQTTTVHFSSLSTRNCGPTRCRCG